MKIARCSTVNLNLKNHGQQVSKKHRHAQQGDRTRNSDFAAIHVFSRPLRRARISLSGGDVPSDFDRGDAPHRGVFRTHSLLGRRRGDESLFPHATSYRRERNAQNGDGMDIESCQNVLIKNNIISVGDDGICLKSGKNREARLTPIPTKNVEIKGNIVYNAHGGIVFGSEMSRGIKDVYCKNNTFIGTDIGLRFKTQIGRGGVVCDIVIEDTYMHDISGEAIILTCGYELYRMANESRDIVNNILPDDIPEFTNIKITNLHCDGAKIGISMNGLEEKPINHIYFKDIYIKANEKMKEINTKDIYMDNVNIITD